jgi:glyoxylase I family protein
MSSSPISRGRSPSIRSCSASQSWNGRPCKNVGAWLACGTLQLHLTVHRPGSFRTSNIDNDDCHFGFRTDDFDGALATLTAGGFREDAAEDDPMRVFVRRNSPAGFPQLYLLDPDRNIIEINGAA